MPGKARIAAVAMCIAALVSAGVLWPQRASGDHFLQESEDPYKVQFISGNLTAAVTKNWPRVDFQHTDNLLSPMFEISIPRLFLFNDTNGDGVFSLSEAQYSGLLEDSYVTWNVSTIEFGRSAEAGEYATTSMSGWVSLYNGLVDQTLGQPAVKNWGLLRFSFIITENPVTYSNSFGQYAVNAKTDLRIVMELTVSHQIGANFLAIEQQLLAGGSVYRFLIREQSSKSEGTVLTPVSSRNDERSLGLNYTHRILQTRLPTQDIDFVNDKGLVQAYYRYSSEPTTNDSGSPRPASLNSSYHTTGTSMMVYPSYHLGNRTDNITHDMSIGLDMQGFVRVRDWAMRNLPILGAVVGGIAVMAVLSVHVWRRKKRMAAENGYVKDLSPEKMDDRPS